MIPFHPLDLYRLGDSLGYAHHFRARSVSHIHNGHAPMKSSVLTASDDVPVAT